MDSERASASKILAALTGAAAWFSAGTVAYTGGGADRVAALPPISFLIVAVAVPIALAHVVRLRLRDAWPLAISFLIVLPFIPGSIPPAFLLWQGPIEAVIWILVAVGMIIGRGGASGRVAVLVDPARAPWIAAGAIATLSLLAFNQVRAVVPGGDEPHYLVATQSLIGDRDLKVENNYAAGDYLEYFDGRLQPHFLQRSSRGEIYSIHSPGVSLIVLPAFMIAGYAGAVATVIALVSLAAALTWIVAWRVSRSGAAAWMGVLSVFATAPFLFHAFTIYPDGVGALMVIAAVWLVARLDDEELPGPGVLVMVGALLAALPWLHTRFALLAAVFGVAVVARLVLRRAPIVSIAAFLIVPIIAACAWLGYFWTIWGTPSPLAPYGRDTESSISYIARGLTGLSFDQQHGVAGTAPILAFAVAGWWPLLKQRKPLAFTIAIAGVAYAIAVSTYAMWWGGTSAPGRFVAAILPIAGVVIAAAWQAYPRMRTVALLLLFVSMAMVIPRLTEESGRFVYNSRNAFDPTIEWLSPSVDLSQGLPSAHRDPPAIVLRDASVWLLAFAAAIGGSLAMSRNASAGMKWTAVLGSAAVSAMAVATLVWTLHDAQPVTASRSMLAALSSRGTFNSIYLDLGHRRVLADENAYLSGFELAVPAADGAALARLSRVPAGTYRLTTDAARPEGRLTIVVGGRNDSPIESVSTGEPFTLNLPAGAATLSIRADTGATTGATGLRLKPVWIERSCCARPALRAARYGSARVFFLDDRAYPEPRGFWTRGEGQAALVIDADETSKRSGRSLAFRAGAAATTIGISGRESQSFSLTPGEQQTFQLTPIGADRTWSVAIHSGPGFRPFQHEQGSTDVRLLAAWFEIP